MASRYHMQSRRYCTRLCNSPRKMLRFTRIDLIYRLLSILDFVTKQYLWSVAVYNLILDNYYSISLSYIFNFYKFSWILETFYIKILNLKRCLYTKGILFSHAFIN